MPLSGQVHIAGGVRFAFGGAAALEYGLEEDLPPAPGLAASLWTRCRMEVFWLPTTTSGRSSWLSGSPHRSRRACNTNCRRRAHRLESMPHLTAAAARHQAKTEMMAVLRTASMPLVARCNGGGGRPGVAAKSAWHPWSALIRSDVGWACLCSTSRGRDPRGDSARSR